MKPTWNSVLGCFSFEFLETLTSQQKLIFTHVMAFTLPCGFLCNSMVILRTTKLGKVNPCQPVFPCCTSYTNSNCCQLMKNTERCFSDVCHMHWRGPRNVSVKYR